MQSEINDVREIGEGRKESFPSLAITDGTSGLKGPDPSVDPVVLGWSPILVPQSH